MMVRGARRALLAGSDVRSASRWQWTELSRLVSTNLTKFAYGRRRVRAMGNGAPKFYRASKLDTRIAISSHICSSDKEDFESSFYQILSARHSERGSHGKQASGYRVLMQVLAVLASSTGAGVYSVDLTSYSIRGGGFWLEPPHCHEPRAPAKHGLCL